MLKIEIKSAFEKSLLERAIDKEMHSLLEAMKSCDQNDFQQYQIYKKAENEYDTLKEIKNELDQ